MPTLASSSSCTGCAACMNACAKGAITMSPQGRLGHLFPVVDSEKCVDCGLCAKSCPALEPVELRRPATAYAGWAKSEEENRKSSSGGAASVLTRKVLQDGGVVYGCANIGMDVRHVRIESEEDIDLLRGSKYVQSTMGLIMQQVKQDLAGGRQVMFVGSPCQCAGLRAFLRKDYDNLLLVDLICHGTPSLQLLQEHVRSKVGADRTVEHIYFRNGNQYELSLVARDAEGKEEVVYRSNLWKQRYHDAYLNTFIESYTFRPSCNQCRYARPERCSDITVGDFWGLGASKQFTPVAKAYGYSAVLPCTDKGAKALEGIADRFYLQERDLEEAVAGNAQLQSPKPLSLGGKAFQWLFSHGLSHKAALLIADFYKAPIHIMKNKIEKL